MSLEAILVCALAMGESPLVEVERIAMRAVDGRIDHLAFDPEQGVLYVAALERGWIEVLDLAKRSIARRIIEVKEPQGILFLPETKELAFTTGGDGRLHVHDAVTLEPRRNLQVGRDADNVRFDPATKRLYVGCEEGLAVIDTKIWEHTGTIALAGKAEGFALDPPSDCARILVNVPAAEHVAVVDAKEREVVATWPTGDATKNYPMALDAASQRLYVGCRQPPCLLVLDIADGRRVQKVEIGGDCDDVFVDAERSRVYASCGSGTISVIGRRSPDDHARVADVATSQGARTCLFLPAERRLIVAVPHRGNQTPEVRIFETR